MIGYIYSLDNPNTGDVFYVGSTVNSLPERLSCHVTTSQASPKFKKYILDHKITPTITLISKVDVDSLSELRKLEKEEIVRRVESGERLINTRFNPDNPVKDTTKSVKISKAIHKKIKAHIIEREESLVEFLDRAAETQIKSDRIEKRILKSSTK